MWIWLLITALANQSLVCLMAESIGSEFQEDLPDDSMFLILDQRSIKDNNMNQERRSALDNNFIRLGRGRDEPFFPNHLLRSPEDFDYNDDFNRPSRTVNKNDNFIRFGRGKASDFIRFGRDPSYLRDLRGKDKNFIRFGRSLPTKRNKRDTNEIFNAEDKRHTNALRFGRKRNFMRFGRMPFYGNANNNQDFDNFNSSSQVPSEKLLRNSYPMSILPLLKQLAERLRFENKCIDCSRVD